jgi:hypothetical protein
MAEFFQSPPSGPGKKIPCGQSGPGKDSLNPTALTPLDASRFVGHERCRSESMSGSELLDILRNGKIRRTTIPGPKALFRRKRRAPVTITLTPDHHMLVNAAKVRLGLSRADLIGLLIEKYASTVTTDGILPNDGDPQRSLQFEDNPRSLHSPAHN